MAATPKCLTDEQWAKIGPLLPSEKPGSKGGRPPAPKREVLEGILRVLRTGARWQDLPQRYPSPSTSWRRLKRWTEQDLWLKIWRTFLSQLDAEGLLDWEQAFIDVSFAPAKKGGSGVEKTKEGKGSKWMVVVDGQGIPLGGTITSASPGSKAGGRYFGDHQSAPPRSGAPQEQTQSFVGDKAYGSDKLRGSLGSKGIRLLVPYRRNRKTSIGGKLNGPSPGWAISEDWWSVMSA